ncbi:MAG: S1C family serine protease [Geodermatophilaceae bacterium]
MVTISATGSNNGGTGSGVVMSTDGYVITNSHVVTLDGTTTNAKLSVRTDDATSYEAMVVGTDPTSDIAVIKLQDATGLTPATFADSEKIQVGDVAVAIGAPLGLSGTVTDGIISAVHRAVTTGSGQSAGDSTVIDAIQTDAAINPGNSGGALVSATGEVIGINSAIASVAQTAVGGQGGQSGNIGIGFAIPSNSAVDIAKQLIVDGTAEHGYLGAGVAAGDSGAGAMLQRLSADGPAAAAGLQAGDVVTAIDSRQVEAPADLVAAVRSHAPGDTVTLTYTRNGDSSQATVTLGTAPTSTG